MNAQPEPWRTQLHLLNTGLESLRDQLQRAKNRKQRALASELRRKIAIYEPMQAIAARHFAELDAELEVGEE